MRATVSTGDARTVSLVEDDDRRVIEIHSIIGLLRWTGVFMAVYRLSRQAGDGDDAAGEDGTSDLKPVTVRYGVFSLTLG
jgi:hypothetical protein